MRFERVSVTAVTRSLHMEEGMSLDILSPREREITLLIFDGWQSKEIATKLGIGLRTIEGHRRHILAKLGAINFVEIAWKVRLATAEAA
jgi:DNA-binding CsgD family transcriptional regulator